MAADINHIMIIGRLTRDADLKYTSGGFAISNFSIAVNRRRKNGDQWIEEANFFEINLYGKSAESLKPYLIKGKQVAVDGELRQDRWEQDGQPRSKVVIVANNVQLLGGNAGSSGSSPINQECRNHLFLLEVMILMNHHLMVVEMIHSQRTFHFKL